MKTKPTIKLIEINQDWNNETTFFWFRYNSKSYAIAVNTTYYDLLDSEGWPIDPIAGKHATIYRDLLTVVKNTPPDF